MESFKTKTLSSNRIIPITNSLAKVLKSYLGNKKNGYVFESNKKGSILKNSVIGFVNKFANLCNSLPVGQNGKKNIGTHILRRTYASYLINNGITIDKIAGLLGHKSIQTTMKYLFEITSMDFDDVRDVLKKMNK